MSFTWHCCKCRQPILIENANSPNEMSPYATAACPTCYSQLLAEAREFDALNNGGCTVEEEVLVSSH